MYNRHTPDENAAEVAQLVAEQRADDGPRQWLEHRRSISLDTPATNENGNESGTVGTKLIGYDPWDAIDDALDVGLDPLETPDVYADSTRVAAAGTAWLPNHLRDKVWDTATIIASRHPFAHTEQFAQAYGSRGRRRPNSSRVAPAIVVKLFAAIVTAVGTDAARNAAVRRGRPSPVDQRARNLAALAVQALCAMGYTPRSVAVVLELPARTVQRYANVELPMLSASAHARIFGGSLTAAASEANSVPASETDATRGGYTPAPASPPNFKTNRARRTTRQ
jgi:hypothetical protein